MLSLSNQILAHSSGWLTSSSFRTDEMRPQWFHTGSKNDSGASEIPYEQMWDDDRYWFPLLLSKRPFVGRADFKQEGEIFSPKRWWFGVSESSSGTMVNPAIVNCQ